MNKINLNRHNLPPEVEGGGGEVVIHLIRLSQRLVCPRPNPVCTDKHGCVDHSRLGIFFSGGEGVTVSG